jgi:polyisoprenoid-binding protein YceI
MSSTTATREDSLAGVLPVEGLWDLDISHTTVEFVARHLMVSKVRGRFGRFTGHINVGPTPDKSSARGVIEAASIDTNAEQRDGHLKSPDFLDAETYPEITWQTTKVEPAGKNRFEVTGDFTIRDITRPLTLDVRFNGTAAGPMGEVAFFSARGEFDREDFGMTWNQVLESGGWLVGKKVTIEIEAEAIRQN